MPKMTQLAVSLENKPGALAQLCQTLARSGVNIEGIFVPDVSGRGKIRTVVSDPEAAKRALKDAKLRCAEEEVISLALENKPGALGEVAAKLERARVNIRYAYATTSGPGRATVVLAVSNLAKGLAALGQ